MGGTHMTPWGGTHCIIYPHTILRMGMRTESSAVVSLQDFKVALKFSILHQFGVLYMYNLYIT
jgi:hypothetical protein